MIVAILFALAGIRRGSVAGHVISGDENAEPLPGVTVCVKETKICVATDASGYFEIGNLPLTGSVMLTADLPGFHRVEIIACVSKGKQAEAVFILPVEEGGDCILSGPETLTYEAIGTITDSGNHPIRRATVRIRDGDGKIVWHGRSDRKGRFDAQGLRTHVCTLEAAKPNYLQQTVKLLLGRCRPRIELTIPLARGCS